MPLFMKTRSFLRNLFLSRRVEVDLARRFTPTLKCSLKKIFAQACSRTKHNAPHASNLAASSK